ncbi:MAG: hypothetical protein HY020_07060 [Burkholderiales bacterium]|nr:hypothetical protein [Burkholderiales bacterium]
MKLQRPSPAPYLSSAKTKALLTAGLAGRNERLQAGDMISVNEAAELASTTPVTIDAWIAEGRAIGLNHAQQGYRLPRWQFEPAVWAVLVGLAQALNAPDGWVMLSFLETPLGGLNGRTPRQAVEQGEASRVLQLAGSAL